MASFSAFFARLFRRNKRQQDSDLFRKLASGGHPEGGSAWKGSWERPVEVDEKSLDPLTVARMTDHNVRGPAEHPSRSEPISGEAGSRGKVSPADEIKIESYDLPGERKKVG